MNTDDIERKLYESLVPGAPSIKTALLLMRAYSDETLPSETLINEALGLLGRRSDVAAFGNLVLWRHSELMRLDSSGP